MNFVKIPSVYPKLIELRKSKTAEFKPNKYLKETTKLRYYQVIGALHMMLLNRMVLGDGTGLGKTLCNIAAYSWLLCEDPNLKWLVICTKSAMYQWGEEIDKFTQGITYRIVGGDHDGLTGYKARLSHYRAFKENILIINYDPVREEYEMIKDALGPNFMMTLDEVTAIKNRKTGRHFSCSQLGMHAKRVYGLSATIIKNGLEEVYGIYDVVVPGLFGRITQFKKTFCVEKMMRLIINSRPRMIPKVIGYKNLKEFKIVIDPYFLGRKKEEVASELPKLISKKIILEMGEEQRKAYMDALHGILHEEKVKMEFYELAEKIRNGATDERLLKAYELCKEKYDKFLTEDGRKRGKLAAITYCQMISNGPGLVNMPGESSKEIEFERLITEEISGEKIIVFTRFKKGIPFLEVVCEHHHLPYTKITGDETSKERDIARIRFTSDPNCNIIFITTAGSESLNLQAASVIIFYDTPWSYGDLAQTIGRAQRIGSIQEHVLLIHLVNKNSIDMRIMNRVSTKKGVSDEVLGDTAVGALDFSAVDESAVDDLFSGIMKDAEDVK